jgi:hypothetical protein
VIWLCATPLAASATANRRRTQAPERANHDPLKANQRLRLAGRVEDAALVQTRSQREPEWR